MFDLHQACKQLLYQNRRCEGDFQYTLPSPTSYPHQWFWDSCFHAIIYTHFDITSAKREILSMVARQFDNGMIPHMIYWKGPDEAPFHPIEWGKKGTSTITQPPMIAYAVWRIFEKDGDIKFIKSVYPHLYHFYRYLLTERDPHEKHLIGIINPDESGEDNSPRFDLPLNLPPIQTLEINTQRRMELIEKNIECKFDAPFCMRNFFWVKDVPFNCIMIENLRLLAKLAQNLDNHDDANYFLSKADCIASSMVHLMLEDGIYWSTYGEKYTKIKVKTWAMFAPLFAHILNQEQASKLVNDHLLNKNEFWTNYPVPTTSLDEAAFNPRGFWRGPTWIGINWFIYKGLINYGFTDPAGKIKESSVALLEKSGFREHFHPNTGEGLGAENFTWGGLVIDMN